MPKCDFNKVAKLEQCVVNSVKEWLKYGLATWRKLLLFRR